MMYLRVLSQYMPGVTEENHENPRSQQLMSQPNLCHIRSTINFTCLVNVPYCTALFTF
jgi:hypothetical protein